MREGLFRLGAGLVLALLIAGCAAAADPNATPGANGTAPVAWEHTYGGVANETLLALLGAANGGYRLVGTSAPNGTGEEVYLVATDANGTALSETRTPFGIGKPVSAGAASDGGAVVVGGTDAGDVAILRLLPDGRALWSRTYSLGSGRDQGDAVSVATDGGYLVAGVTDTPTGGSPQLLLLKVDGDGGQIWQRAVSLGAGVLAVRALSATPDGGYLVVGSTDAGQAGSLEILLVKVSSGGNREWQRAYSFGTERADGYAVAPSPDGGWLLLGGVAGTGTPANAAVLVKVDTDGAEQWRTRLAIGGARTWGYALAPAGTTGYAVAGAVEAPEASRSFVALLDRNGAEAWNRSFAIGNGPSRALAVTVGSQNRVVAAGDASRTTETQSDLYLTSVAPPAVAPNVTATTTPNATPNATSNATPPATLPANATPTATGTVPPPTTAPIGAWISIAALASAALAGAVRRR